MLPKINSAHGSDARNIINRAIEVLNRLGIDVQTLVAEGQLTEEQYARLITSVNGLISRGDVSVYDIDKNKGRLDGTYFTQEFLENLNGGVINTTNLLPESATREVLAGRAVSYDKTDFLKRGKNLVDKTKFERGIYSHTTGNINESTSYLLTREYITISPNTEYTQNLPATIVFYDQSFNFISGIERAWEREPATFLTPSDARYLRVSIQDDRLDTYQIEEGVESTPYEEYQLSIETLKVGNKNIPELSPDKIPSIPIEKLPDIPNEKLSLMKPSTNLLNPETVITGKYVGVSTGNLLNSENMITSDYIPIDDTKKYTAAMVRYVGFFDENKEHIEGFTGYHREFTLNPPVGTRFIRFSWSANDIDLSSQHINEGENLLPYEDYGVYIKPELLRHISNEKLIKKTFKVLMIGNSYALDPTTYIPEIAKSANVNVLVGILYRDGESLSSHYQNASNNEANYRYYKRGSENGSVTSYWESEHSMEQVVLSEDWDLITFQQRSFDSDDYTTYQPYLNDLKAYVENLATNDNVQFGIHQTWAYAASRGRNQMDMYNNANEAYQQAMKDIDASILIPSGTAIQSARSNAELMAMDDELTEDGSHLSELGDYITGMTFFETLLAGRFNKDSFADVNFKPNEVSNYHAYLSKVVAKNAALKPLKITEI